jgi:hypothetical protein
MLRAILRPAFRSAHPLRSATFKSNFALQSTRKSFITLVIYHIFTKNTGRASSAPNSYASTIDPTHSASLKLLEEGTSKLEAGDVKGAKTLYTQALEIKKTAGGLFNLGVVCFHLSKPIIPCVEPP